MNRTHNNNVCRRSPLHALSKKSRDLNAGTKRREKYINNKGNPATECASIFDFDDVQSLEGAFTLPQLNSYCFELLFGMLCSTSLAILDWGFIFRPQTRYIQDFDEDLDRSFVSAFGENRFAFFCTNTSSEKLIDK